MPRRPRLNAEEVWAHLHTLSREPFQALLADVLESGPSREEIRAAAKKAPDRWGQLVAIFARLSGYAERQEVNHSHRHLHLIASMSDAELLAELCQADAELAAAGVLEHEAVAEAESGGNAGPREVEHKS